MEKTKITVRVERDALAAARRYAQQHDATLTSLVTEFFRSLARSERSDQATPILDELTGSLSPQASVEEYREHLQRKHLGGE